MLESELAPAGPGAGKGLQVLLIEEPKHQLVCSLKPEACE